VKKEISYVLIVPFLYCDLRFLISPENVDKWGVDAAVACCGDTKNLDIMVIFVVVGYNLKS
jgi:hypothetical protein